MFAHINILPGLYSENLGSTPPFGTSKYSMLLLFARRTRSMAQGVSSKNNTLPKIKCGKAENNSSILLLENTRRHGNNVFLTSLVYCF